MQSGTTWRMGHIHKPGPKALRWILTTCADSAVKSPGKFQRLFRRGETRLGKGKAIVAVAHQMIEGICALLSRGESYSEERAESTRRKLPRMKGPARPLPVPDLARRVGSLPNMATAILRGGRG
jgi:hypothetical protein